MDVRGFGRGRARGSARRMVEELVEYMPRVKIEVLCHDDLADEVVATIEQTAHTSLRGDGKVYVTPVETAVRISTGKRGDAAL